MMAGNGTPAAMPNMSPTQTATFAALKERLAHVFAAFPEIQAVYLFGSTAADRAQSHSDLDLAIVPVPGATYRKLDYLAALTAQGFDKVDLVSLDTSDLVLRFEAVRPNRIVYATPQFDHGAFYSRVVREYFDFEPYLLRQRQALRQRISRASP
jgi:hypothetical protein